MPTAPTFDLQAHSLHSDGELPAAEVVERAAAAGVELFALSDHDTVDGVDEALAAGERTGIRVVPAIEISAVGDGEHDLHLLGYCLDHRDAQLRSRLEEFRADRELRADRMAERLEAAGFALDRDPIEARRASGTPIGRPHLAAAALAHPDNVQRLQAEEIAETGAFIEAYLVPGAPAWLPRLTPGFAEAIETVHAARGLAVAAHPFFGLGEPDAVLRGLDELLELGIDGVEAFYATHTRAQAELLADYAAEHGLLATGSSDFHGPGHALFNRFRAFELHGREPVLGAIASGCG